MIYKDIVFLIADGQPDSSGNSFSMDSKIEYPETMPLTVYRGDSIAGYVGWAKNIRQIDSKLVADLYLVSNSPVPIEVLKHLRPCVSGKVKSRKNANQYGDISIKSLELAAYNADSRIKSLADYSIEGKKK